MRGSWKISIQMYKNFLNYDTKLFYGMKSTYLWETQSLKVGLRDIFSLWESVCHKLIYFWISPKNERSNHVAYDQKKHTHKQLGSFYE